MPKVTVRIDPELCITAANCVGIAPELFQIGDTAAEIFREGALQGREHTFEASADDLDQIDEAVASCPTRAITVIREA